LLIAGEGVLQYLPFAALPEPTPDKPDRPEGPTRVPRAFDVNGTVISDNATPLIVAHEIVSVPSASVLAVLRREARSRPAADKTLAVFADPVFEASDPRIGQQTKLPPAPATDQVPPDIKRSGGESGLQGFLRLRFSRQEADQVARFAGETKKLKALDFAASRSLATSGELSRYSIVHFATHGLINNEHPELSGIVLSLVDQQGQPQNGFLRLYDIYNLKLQADLVVLSACQTALGKQIKGEGLIGLTRGFMYAGAPRVIASLWQVDDRASADLMGRFYEAMLSRGLSPAAALRAAQISAWRDKRWRAPYYWAAFTLQGEWK
jgi:CHAT domain-containing protein